MTKKKKNDDLDFLDMDDTPDESIGEMDIAERTPKTFNSDILTMNINDIPMCDMGSLKIIKFRVEAPEDYVAGSIFGLCRIPPSEVRVLFRLSNLEFEGIEDGSIGYTRYRTRKRENIPTDPNGLNDAVQNMKTVKFDSLEGVFIVFTAAKDGKKGDAIDGYIVYSKM